MTKFDHIYKDLVMKIINDGKMQRGDVRAKYVDGANAYTKYIHGVNFEITPDSIPLLQSKRVAFKSALIEMEWIAQKMSNDVNWLKERNVKIWNEWCLSDGTIGPAYGWQLRNKVRPTPRGPLNQMEYVVDQIQNNPRSRRIMTTLFEIDDLDSMALEPCVWSTHWEVDDDDYLILHVKQRSADVMLGLPFNVFQYSMLQRVMAKATGKKVGSMFWCIDNAHIYDRHLGTAELQVTSPYDENEPLITLPPKTNFFNMNLSEIKVDNYNHNGNFKFEIAI